MKHPGEPLGLPHGSVRAIITLLVVIPLPVLVILAFLRGVADIPEEVFSFYTVIVLLVVKDYFGSRGTTVDSELQGDIAKDE
jgi:hypothetical protein